MRRLSVALSYQRCFGIMMLQFPGYGWSKPFLSDKSCGAVETIVACQVRIGVQSGGPY